MSEHTKGPWQVWDKSPTFVEREDGSPIASMTLGANYEPEQYQVRLREMEANARLIAAAPELLEALEATLSTVMSRWLSSGDGRDSVASKELLDKVVAAIAKSEGRP